MHKLDREKTVINLYVAGHPIDDIWRASGFKSRSSVFRILNKHGIKLNRGNHSGPIKKRAEQTPKTRHRRIDNEENTIPAWFLCDRQLPYGECYEREAFEGCAVVLTPDLPLHPKEALKEIRSIIDKKSIQTCLSETVAGIPCPDALSVVGIPALLGNPYFKMTEFLKVRIGEHQYKAPRKDGNQRLVIDEALIEEFSELEAVQFDCCNPYYKKNEYGDFLVSRTPLLTSPHCLWSTTTISIIFLAVILQQNKK